MIALNLIFALLAAAATLPRPDDLIEAASSGGAPRSRSCLVDASANSRLRGAAGRLTGLARGRQAAAVRAAAPTAVLPHPGVEKPEHTDRVWN